MEKNILMQSAAKHGVKLPEYSVVSYGPPHSKLFSSVVHFDGKKFQSDWFPSIKKAHQHASALALSYFDAKNGVSNDPTESSTFSFLKSYLATYCSECGYAPPVYSTSISGPPHCPEFSSSVNVKGLVFFGSKAAKKKVAESLAARTALNYFCGDFDGNPSSSSSSKNQNEGIAVSQIGEKRNFVHVNSNPTPSYSSENVAKKQCMESDLDPSLAHITPQNHNSLGPLPNASQSDFPPNLDLDEPRKNKKSTIDIPKFNPSRGFSFPPSLHSTVHSTMVQNPSFLSQPRPQPQIYPEHLPTTVLNVQNRPLHSTSVSSPVPEFPKPSFKTNGTVVAPNSEPLLPDDSSPSRFSQFLNGSITDPSRLVSSTKVHPSGPNSSSTPSLLHSSFENQGVAKTLTRAPQLQSTPQSNGLEPESKNPYPPSENSQPTVGTESSPKPSLQAFENLFNSFGGSSSLSMHNSLASFHPADPEPPSAIEKHPSSRDSIPEESSKPDESVPIYSPSDSPLTQRTNESMTSSSLSSSSLNSKAPLLDDKKAPISIPSINLSESNSPSASNSTAIVKQVVGTEMKSTNKTVSSFLTSPKSSSTTANSSQTKLSNTSERKSSNPSLKPSLISRML